MTDTIDYVAKEYDRIILKNKCKLKDDCSICLDSLYEKKAACLPCKHYFHHSCLKQALDKKLYTCPLCRYDLLNALMKTDFKFPIVYNPYTYFGVYFSPHYAYDVPDDYDVPDSYDVPELVASDDDEPSIDLTGWTNLFLNITQDHSIDSAYAIVPAPVPILPVPALPVPILPVPALPVPALPVPALPVPSTDIHNVLIFYYL